MLVSISLSIYQCGLSMFCIQVESLSLPIDGGANTAPPAVKLAQVFLFNHSDRTLLGPLSAISPGGMYLEERAWARPGHRSPWPAQVKSLHTCACRHITSTHSGGPS